MYVYIQTCKTIFHKQCVMCTMNFTNIQFPLFVLSAMHITITVWVTTKPHFVYISYTEFNHFLSLASLITHTRNNIHIIYSHMYLDLLLFFCFYYKLVRVLTDTPPSIHNIIAILVPISLKRSNPAEHDTPAKHKTYIAQMLIMLYIFRANVEAKTASCVDFRDRFNYLISSNLSFKAGYGRKGKCKFMVSLDFFHSVCVHAENIALLVERITREQRIQYAIVYLYMNRVILARTSLLSRSNRHREPVVRN